MFSNIAKFEGLFRDLVNWKDSNAVSSLFYVVKQFFITRFLNENFAAHGKDVNASILCSTMLEKLLALYFDYEAQQGDEMEE